jgi:MFS family permease
MALWTAAFMGSTAVGGPLMGWIAEHHGARAALLTGGSVALATAAVAVLRSSPPPRSQAEPTGTVQPMLEADPWRKAAN